MLYRLNEGSTKRGARSTQMTGKLKPPEKIPNGSGMVPAARPDTGHGKASGARCIFLSSRAPYATWTTVRFVESSPSLFGVDIKQTLAVALFRGNLSLQDIDNVPVIGVTPYLLHSVLCSRGRFEISCEIWSIAQTKQLLQIRRLWDGSRGGASSLFNTSHRKEKNVFKPPILVPSKSAPDPNPQ